MTPVTMKGVITLDAPQRRTLARAMTMLGTVVERSTLPIVGCVLLRASDGVLSLTTNGVERECSFTMPVLCDAAFTIAVDAGRFAAFVHAIDADEPFVMTAEDKVLRLRSGASTRATLPLVLPEDFPLFAPLDDARVETVDAATLSRMLAQTGYAMAQHDVRYYLQATHWVFEFERLDIEATDGHRAAKASHPIERATPDRLAALVPRKTALVLSRLLDGAQGEVRLLVDDRALVVNIGDFTVTSRLVDGKYPDLHRAIPRTFIAGVEVDRAALLAAIGRVAVAGDGRGVKGPVLSLRLDADSLALEVQGLNGLDAVDAVAAVVHEGVGFSDAFTLSYLVEAVEAIATERLMLQFNDAKVALLTPVGATAVSASHVVMGRRA